MNDKLLKLRAEDDEDMQVISAVLQDAIVPVCDMAYQATDKSFVMVAQRLRREAQGDMEDPAERICCALTVKGVMGVQTHSIDLRASDRILDLLAIMVNAPAEGHVTPAINLVFAGGGKIRLELAHWVAIAEDFGEPWPTLSNPCHESKPDAS